MTTDNVGRTIKLRKEKQGNLTNVGDNRLTITHPRKYNYLQLQQKLFSTCMHTSCVALWNGNHDLRHQNSQQGQNNVNSNRDNDTGCNVASGTNEVIRRRTKVEDAITLQLNQSGVGQGMWLAKMIPGRQNVLTVENTFT